MEHQKLSNGKTLAEACSHLIAQDEGLNVLHEEYSYPDLKPGGDPYEALVRSIISQQISWKAAHSIYSKFLALFPGEVFPDPQTLAGADLTLLRQAGLSQRKAEYVSGIAEAFLDPGFLGENIAQLSDEEVSAKLTHLRGVGQWTADMFMIFTLARPDILPLSDLGIKKGLQVFFHLSDLPTEAEMQALTKHWRPYRSVASWYMWKVVDEKWEWSSE